LLKRASAVKPLPKTYSILPQRDYTPNNKNPGKQQKRMEDEIVGRQASMRQKKENGYQAAVVTDPIFAAMFHCTLLCKALFLFSEAKE
jgi:hypothetical protein